MTAPVNTQPVIDYHDPDLPDAYAAAIEFLALDGRWYRALHRHVPDFEFPRWCGRCVSLHWPCLTWTLAEAAHRAAYPDIPAPRQEPS